MKTSIKIGLFEAFSTQNAHRKLHFEGLSEATPRRQEVLLSAAVAVPKGHAAGATPLGTTLALASPSSNSPRRSILRISPSKDGA